MSAYIVDPRTIDYLVQWAHQVRDGSSPRLYLDREEYARFLPEYGWAMSPGMQGAGVLSLVSLSPDILGQLLLNENVRSVRYRYEDCAPDDLPGPCDQSRVWRYRFRPIAADLKPAWVVKSCDCLDYQSCETDDWKDTLAYKIVRAIRESAIHAMTDDAPWGVTDDDLAPTHAR